VKESGIPRPTFSRAASFVVNSDTHRIGNKTGRFPYLEKLRWACREIGFHEQYADFLGSQFLSLEDARPITHINGVVPVMGDLVECVAQCFIKIVDFADLVLLFIDDFQWVDSFTWRVIRALSQSGRKMLLVCASRSHDKQAMRRMSSGMSSTGVDSKSEITLGPLELNDMRELISSLLSIPNDDKIDEDICTQIYQKTGGLPVYVIELLETVKRNKSYYHDKQGNLQLSIKDSEVGEECSALVLNQMLNRFDALGAQVRKILHTCAVLGNSFSLFDLARVHPELDFHSVEDALNVAVSEMILFELGEDDEKSAFSSSSHGNSNSKPGSSIVEFSRTSSRVDVEGERNFEFSHDMWRTTVLTTLLEARKIELHRRIAIAMEKENDGHALEHNDPSRLLALFEHWKSCGDFLKAAPLALTVGAKLHEWELANQSIELYRDALGMSLRSVAPAEKNWNQTQGQYFR
jgi:hypothetical protein